MSDTEIDVLVAESLAPIELDVAEDGEQIQLDVSECIGGGGGVDVNPLTVIANGVYTAPEGEAYSPVAVNVPNSYAAGDEGKVVSNGALVAQTARSSSLTENGTYDTTLNNSVTVAVPQPSGTKTVNISQNGTTLEDVSAYASASIVVAVPVPVLDTLTATDNGTYTPASGHAYSSVVVAIPSASGVSF